MLMRQFISESASANLAKFLCHLPSLTSASLNEFNLSRTFFRTISSQASRCKAECINIDGKRLNELLSDYPRGKKAECINIHGKRLNELLSDYPRRKKTPSVSSVPEDESSHDIDQGSAQ
ncbi:uncharacterized protein [Diadema setosum]|uniref:uncharacterized protein n=1 Tax=Diadema setosum TaxID=31175 RepID=UPI003B39FAB6